jgi:hypothetical protein
LAKMPPTFTSLGLFGQNAPDLYPSGSFGQNASDLYPSGSFGQIVWRRSRCVRGRSTELPNCEFAARQCALLVSVERRHLRERGTIEGPGSEQPATGLPHTHRIGLRCRNLQCDLKTTRVGILSRDRARQMAHLGDQRGIMDSRHAQPVPARVARTPRLALGSLRTSAGAAVGPARLALLCTSHPGSCSVTLRGQPSVRAIHPFPSLDFAECSCFVLHEKPLPRKENLLRGDHAP